MSFPCKTDRTARWMHRTLSQTLTNSYYDAPVMIGPWELRLYFRAVKRLKAFKRAMDAGASPDEARALSYRYFPPKPADLKYEQEHKLQV